MKNNYPTFYDRYAGEPSQNDLHSAPDLSFQAQPDQQQPFNPWMEMAGAGAQDQAEKPQKLVNSPWEMA
jgi:hypothetical protein